MAMCNGDAHSEGSYEASEISSTETDALDDFLSRYTFTCNPEKCLKFRGNLGPVSLRANRYFGGRRSRWVFVAKPSDDERSKWLHKLDVDPSYCIARICTAKIKLWNILRVQAVAQYDWELRQPAFQWKVTSKWSRGQGKLGRKEKFQYDKVPGLELHPHWRVNLFMPEVEGCLGSGNAGEAVHVEKGHCHITIPKVELIFRLNELGCQSRSLLQRFSRCPNQQDRHAAAEGKEAGAGLPSASSRDTGVGGALQQLAEAEHTSALHSAECAGAAAPGWWQRQRQHYQEAQLGHRCSSSGSANLVRPSFAFPYVKSSAAVQGEGQSSASGHETQWESLVRSVKDKVLQPKLREKAS